MDLQPDTVAETVPEVRPPYPASAIRSRAAASTSWAIAPGRTARRPARWAARTSSYSSRCHCAGSPTATVLVMSAW